MRIALHLLVCSSLIACNSEPEAREDGGTPGASTHEIPACSRDGWCWDYPRPWGGTIADVYRRADNDVWAIGEMGTIAHFDGSVWQGISSGTDTLLTAIAGNDGGVWVLASRGVRDNGLAIFSVNEEAKTLTPVPLDGIVGSEYYYGTGLVELNDNLWVMMSDGSIYKRLIEDDVWEMVATAGHHPFSQRNNLYVIGGKVWYGDNVMRVLRGSNDGVTWTEIPLVDPPQMTQGEATGLLWGPPGVEVPEYIFANTGLSPSNYRCDAMQCRQTSFPLAGFIASAWGTSSNDLWVATTSAALSANRDTYGGLYHWGTQWNKIEAGAGPYMTKIIGSDSKNFAVFSAGSSVSHYNGTGFERIHGSVPTNILGFDEDGARWAVGEDGFVIERTLHGWERRAISGLTDDLFDVSVTSSGTVWMVGERVYRFANGALQDARVHCRPGKPATGVHADSDEDVWVLGAGFACHWDGTSWTDKSNGLPAPPTRSPTRVTAFGTNEVYAYGDGVYKWSGLAAAWNVVVPNGPTPFQEVRVPSQTSWIEGPGRVWALSADRARLDLLDDLGTIVSSTTVSSAVAVFGCVDDDRQLTLGVSTARSILRLVNGSVTSEVTAPWTVLGTVAPDGATYLVTTMGSILRRAPQ